MTKKLPPTTPPTLAEWISFGFFTLGTIGQVIAGAVMTVVGIIGMIVTGSLLIVVVGVLVFICLLLL